MLDAILDLTVRQLAGVVFIESILIPIGWMLSFPIVGTYRMFRPEDPTKRQDTANDDKGKRTPPIVEVLLHPNVATTIVLLIAGNVALLTTSVNDSGIVSALLVITALLVVTLVTAVAVTAFTALSRTLGHN